MSQAAAPLGRGGPGTLDLIPASSSPVTAKPPRRKSDGMASTLALGTVACTALVLGIGVWGLTTKLAGAVIASGTVVVESAVKKVQHQTGGTVGQILVHDGQEVKAGQVLLKLDDTMTRANLQILSQQYDRTLARQARLEAERIGEPAIRFPAELRDRMNDPEVAELVKGEEALFESRAKSLAGQKAQLEARVGQLGEQISGLKAQQAATDDSVRLLTKDLTGVQGLYVKKLVSMERVGDLQLDAARMQGEAGRLTAALAETEGRISEIKLQIIQLDEQLRSDVNTDLRETEGQVVELVERKLVAQDQLQKVEIRAPQDGTVQELAVHTVGGVLGPGETAMLLVPNADGLVIDAAISPVSIDDVHIGQPVIIRFSAFDMTTTPVCYGTVERVSADLIRDPRTQTSFYSVRMDLNDEKACLEGQRKLIPGMPAEVHVQTGERSVWSYVMKPLTDQIARSFKQ